MTRDAIDITLAGIRSDRQLHYENYQVMSAVQALWGAITPSMVAISVECIGAEVRLHFYLEHESPVDREEIEDVATDLASLQFTSVPIQTHVHLVGRAQQDQVAGRLVYRRHEPSDRRLTLSSSGHVPAGFACLHVPLMSNVRRHGHPPHSAR